MANYRSGVAGGPREHLTNPLGLDRGAGCYSYPYPECISDDYNWIHVAQNWTDSQYQYLFNFASTPLPPGHPIGRRVYTLFNEPDRGGPGAMEPRAVVSKADWLMKELRARDANCLFIGFNISQEPNTQWTSYPGNPYPDGSVIGVAKQYMWDVLAWWKDFYDHLAVGPCRLWRPTFHSYGYSDDPVGAAQEIENICREWKAFWGLHAPQFSGILPEFQDRPIITEMASHPLKARNSAWYNTFFNELYNWLASTGVQPPVPIAGWAWFLCHNAPPEWPQWWTELHTPLEITPAGVQYKMFADRWG